MKRNILITLSALVLALMLTGCSAKENNASHPENNAQPTKSVEAEKDVNEKLTEDVTVSPTKKVEAEKNKPAQGNEEVASEPAENSTAQKTEKNPVVTTLPATGKVTRDEAKQIAFDHAGVKAENVYNLKIEYDRDDRIPSYEIEFNVDKLEYEYDIHAETGKILKAEKEFDRAPSSKPATTKNDNNTIGKEKAKTIAFNHAGVKAENVYDLEVELDRDEKIANYEVSFKADRLEYDYKIHAETGEILRVEKERD